MRLAYSFLAFGKGLNLDIRFKFYLPIANSTYPPELRSSPYLTILFLFKGFTMIHTEISRQLELSMRRKNLWNLVAIYSKFVDGETALKNSKIDDRSYPFNVD